MTECVGLWVVTILSFARFIAPVVTITSILSANKIQNGDVLVPAKPDPSEKMAVKRKDDWI